MVKFSSSHVFDSLYTSELHDLTCLIIFCMIVYSCNADAKHIFFLGNPSIPDLFGN